MELKGEFGSLTLFEFLIPVNVEQTHLNPNTRRKLHEGVYRYTTPK
jgi:hypothetical protein